MGGYVYDYYGVMTGLLMTSLVLIHGVVLRCRRWFVPSVEVYLLASKELSVSMDLASSCSTPSSSTLCQEPSVFGPGLSREVVAVIRLSPPPSPPVALSSGPTTPVMPSGAS